MNIDVKALHFELTENTKEYLHKKLERIAYAKDMIVDLLFVFNKEKVFKLECTLNFRWGVSTHLTETSFELNEAIDKLVDKVEHKITKEKEKVQQKQ
jgi:putative sigma-54 modulation protein